jgi:iron complex transport system substrate-binding protein
MTHRPLHRTLAALGALAVVLAACGSDDDTATDASAAESAPPASEEATGTVYPLTIDNCGTEIVIETAPENVVVVDTSLAETLVALGVSDRIVGTYFDFQNGGIDPANRTVLDTLTVLGEGGYPSRETVVALSPDFVFAFGDGDFEQEGAPTRDDLAPAAIYRSEAFGCADGEGGVQSSFDEILDLGAIFDRQAEARAIVDAQQARLTAVEEAVADLDKPRVIYWDAYDFENVRLLPFGFFQDAATRAGGEILFADVTDATPVSKEQIATSDVDVVLAIDYGAETTDPLLPLMAELVAETPAGQRDDGGVVPVTNYPPNLQAVSLVEAIAQVLHPDIDLG